MSPFNRLTKLELLKHDDNYFLVKYAPELVQHFPSLSEIILSVYSFDSCTEIIDVLLTGLPKFVYIKINFQRNISLVGPFTSEYIIEKYRGILDINGKKIDYVSVKKDGKSLIILFE